MKPSLMMLIVFVLYCRHQVACQALVENNLLGLGSSLTPPSALHSAPSSTFILSFIPSNSSSSSSSSSSGQLYYLTISFAVSPLAHPVWVANRDSAVSASASLILSSAGDLILSDPSMSSTLIWSSGTSGLGVTSAQLLDSGNLVLVDSESAVLWQSFDHPTDTLVPGQPLTADSELISAARTDSLAPGRYHLTFDNSTGALKLSNSSGSASYWDLGAFPLSPTSVSLRFDQLGNISLYYNSSSAQTTLIASDHGSLTALRRITLDVDGNLRMYTWDTSSKKWKSVWLAFTDVCERVLQLCGSYGVCINDPQPKCVCPTGFSVVDSADLSSGCSPKCKIKSCDGIKFLEMEGLDYPFNDYRDFTEATEEECKMECAKECSCRAAVYWQSGDGHCWLKKIVENGYRTGTQFHRVFLKLSNVTRVIPAPVFDTPTQWTSRSLF